MRGSLTGALAGPLTVVAARARRSRTWILPTIALAVVFGFAGALASESVIVGDQGARKILRREPPVDRAMRLVWQGPRTSFALHTADRVFSHLGVSASTQVLLMNAVRLSDLVVHPVAISPLGRWVPQSAIRKLGPCRPTDCPVLLVGQARLPTTLSAAGVRLRIVGRVALSAVPLGFTPNAASGPPVLVTDDITGLGAIGGLSGVYRTFSWVATLPLDRLHSWSLSGYEARLSAAQAVLSPLSTRFTFDAPFAGLSGARARASTAVHRLIVVDGGALVVLVLFLLLAAGALRRDQATEIERLRAAGGHAVHLAAFLGAEASWVAGLAIGAGAALATAFTAIVAGAHGEPAGAVLSHGVLSGTAAGVWAGAWALTASLLAVSPLLGGRRVLDLAALAGTAVLVAGLSLGTGSTSIWAGLLVPLACLSAGLVLFRSIGFLLRAGERVVRRGSPSFRLALVNLGRARGTAGLAIAFLAVSIGLAGFALAFRATLLRGAADQAADRVPLDALISAGASFNTPLQVAPLARFQALSRGRVFPVRRTQADYPDGIATANVPALGVPAAALPLIHGWRASDANEPLAVLARRLRPPGPARTPGPILPAGARTVQVAVHSPDLDLTVALDLRSPTGAVRQVALGTSGLRPRRLQAQVPAGRWEVEAVELAELSGTAITNAHQNGENPAPASQFSARLTVGPLASSGASGRVLARWGLGTWRAVGAASGAGAAGGRAASVTFQTTGFPGVIRPAQPSDSSALPVLVDSRTAAAAGPGGRIGLTLDGAPVQARVVGVLRRFPTVPAGAGGFVVADESLLSGALDAQLPGQGRPDELWISSSRTQALRAALHRGVLGQLTSAFQADIERSLRSDPVASGVTRTLLLTGVVAAVLALLGMLLVLVGPFREPRLEADLEEQGLGPNGLRRELRVRWVVACLLGIWSGLLIALLLDRLTVAAVGAYETGTRQPHLVTVFPALQLVALGAGASLICAACGWAVSEVMWPRRRDRNRPASLAEPSTRDELARGTAR